MSGYEVIADGGSRRTWSAAEKLRTVEETLDGSASISVVARRNGVSANPLYSSLRLVLEGGSVEVTGDDDVTSNRLVLQMDQRIREFERQLGRKTMKVEFLKEALDKVFAKNRPCSCARPRRTIDREGDRTDARVSRSSLHERLESTSRPRDPYRKVDDR